MHNYIIQTILAKIVCVGTTESIDIAFVVSKAREAIVRGFQSASKMNTSDCFVVYVHNKDLIPEGRNSFVNTLRLKPLTLNTCCRKKPK